MDFAFATPLYYEKNQMKFYLASLLILCYNNSIKQGGKRKYETEILKISTGIVLNLRALRESVLYPPYKKSDAIVLFFIF